MLEALSFPFMQNALAAGVLVAVACGIIGTLVVVHRIVFLSGGIAHAAYGGVGLAFFMGFAPLIGIFAFSLAAALIMALVSLSAPHRSDTVIGVIWAVGMAIGVILMDLTPGYNQDLMSYLFGSILAVPRGDVFIMAGISILVFLFTAYFYQDLLASAFDPAYARTRGIPVSRLYVAMVVLVALTVVMVIQVVGLILTIAMLTIGPYIAEKFSRSMTGMMALSAALNLAFTLTGLALAYTFNLTSGACIILTAAAAFFFSLAANRLKTRKA